MADSVFAVDRNDISAQIRRQLSAPSAPLQELAKLCVEVERHDAEIRELDQKIRALQQNAAAILRGGELHQKRGELISLRDTLTKTRNERIGSIQQQETQLAELKREETNQQAIVSKAGKGQSLIALAHKYREAAADIRSRAAIQLRKQLAEHVGDLWVEITERSREFLGMDFDDQWNCILLRRDGKRASWEETNTSAGQRQVRMLAFYEALRRLARTVPPLVVDTPLARLDKEVKNSVLDKLYLTGHQSIILSTNSEIDPEGPAFDRIKDRFARAYTLHPHGDSHSVDYEVRITNDYFGKQV